MDWFTLFLLYCVLSPIVVSVFRGYVVIQSIRLGYGAYRKAKKELSE